MKRFVFLLAFFTLVPSIAFAVRLNLNYPNFGPFNPATNQSLPEIIGYLYYFIVGIAGLAAFVMLVWGGVQWLVSGAIPSQSSEAKDRVRNAIIGLLLVLSSFLIIQTINPELTILRGTVLVDPCDDPVNAEKCKGALGKREPGVYLCEKDNCQGNYVYIDPTACLHIEDLGNIPPSCTGLGGPVNWNDKPTAVQIVGEEFSVHLFENNSYGGRTICFRDSVGRLDSFQLDTSPDTGWAGDMSSLMIMTSNPDWSCTVPEITKVDINDTGFPGPSVFLFNVKDFGVRTGSNWRTFTLPLEYFGTLSPGVTGDGKIHELRQDKFGEDRDPYVLSVWVSGQPLCYSRDLAGNPIPDPYSVGPLKYVIEPCAVRFWESTNWDSSRDANICFRSSQPDLLKYSFNYSPTKNPSCNSASNDIRDDIRGLEVIPASECLEEGVVLNCNV